MFVRVCKGRSCLPVCLIGCVYVFLLCGCVCVCLWLYRLCINHCAYSLVQVGAGMCLDWMIAGVTFVVWSWLDGWMTGVMDF